MNTLAMTGKLKAAGIPEEEARAHIAVVQEAAEEATDGLVTKADLRELCAELKADSAELKADLSLLLVKVVVGALVALTAIFSFVVSIVLSG